ncbi:MAG: putative lipid II flippase FtsW [Spirochaetia bacterium]
MADRFVLERIAPGRADRSGRGDRALLSVLFLLVGVGLAVLFSSSYFWAEQLYGDAFRLIRRQAVYVGLGVVLALVASRISLERLRGSVRLLLLGGLLIMALTFVPGLGEEYLGARRWILLFGYSFQPSEFIKVVVVFYLAHILSKKEGQLNDTLNSIVPPMIVVGLFAAIIYLQNDFSTAAFVIGLALLMMFVARVRFRFFVGLAIVILPLTVILLLTREHRVLRILAFIDPELDRFGSGYQVLAARIALENGGAWGAGIGRSLQKYGSLPEPHSDFVFAIVGEEFGFVGVLSVLGLFTAFAVKGYQTALRAADTFRSLIAFGVTSAILLQALLNMAVVCGLVPATGIPLPFFSAGGSSVLMSLLMCGLLINVARSNDRSLAAQSGDANHG